MPIDFSWQSGDEQGQWEVLAEPRRRTCRFRLPRWLRYVLLAIIPLAAASGYLVVRQRYQQAQQQMVFQIQGVIDLEAEAYAQGDVDLFLDQQDDAAPDWYSLQQQRIQADCPSGAPVSARCAPVLPAEVVEVDLRQDVAWVEVLEDDPAVRRARFYRQTALGWKHTAPRLSFWGHAIELHYGDLIFRYHERDQPHVNALIDRIAQTFYQTCAQVDCPSGRAFEVNFAVDPVLPTGFVPSFQDRQWILPSPWLSGLPASGEWSTAQLEALAYTMARSLATQALHTTPEQPLDLVQRALTSEYASWKATGRSDVAPLLGRIVDRRGEAVLSSLFRWLQDQQQQHTLSALLRRWLDYPGSMLSAQHFQELLQVERDALRTGQRDTFMLLQDDEQALWMTQQASFYEQAGEALRSAAGPLPPIQVESVRVSRGRALVTLHKPLVNVRGEAAQSLGQYAFFVLGPEGWKHSSIGQALYWRVPVSNVQRAPSLPRPSTEGGVTTITYASIEPHSQVESWADVFHARYSEIQVKILDMSDVLAFPEEGLANENGLILYLYQLLAYQGTLMSDVMDLPAFSELSLYGLARDLTPFLEADGALQQDFYPGLLRACQQDGRTWALPARGQPFLIFYDKNAFDEAELPYPQPSWSEADFLEVARQLTLREDGEVRRYGFLNRSGFPIGRAFVEARAGPLIDSSQALPMPRLDTPQVVQAVGWYAGLALQEQVMPNPFQQLNARDRQALVGEMWLSASQGQSAMWADVVVAQDRQAPGRVGTAPFPTATYPGSPWWIEAYTISAESAHPQESWLWVRYLTAQGTDEQRSNASGLLPARRSVAEASGYWAQWDAETTDTIKAAMENAWGYRLDTYTLTLETAIESIWAGTSVEAALAEAQAQLEGE